MAELSRKDKFVQGQTSNAEYIIPMLGHTHFGFWVYFNREGKIVDQYGLIVDSQSLVGIQGFNCTLEDSIQHIFKINSNEKPNTPGALIKLSDDFACIGWLNENGVLNDNHCNNVMFFGD
jgi:hypothetical protein